jgi:hypothetical protein
MPDPTQPQILAAIVAIIDAVDDTGLIISRERNIETDAELINLFRGLNEGVLKGWLVICAGFTQERDGGICDIRRTIKYSLNTIYPYEDKDFGGDNSHDKFRLMVEAVNSAFNQHANWDLGLGTKVEHQLLQATEDFVVQRLGEGADSHLVHLGVFELFVTLDIRV